MISGLFYWSQTTISLFVGTYFDKIRKLDKWGMLCHYTMLPTVKVLSKA